MVSRAEVLDATLELALEHGSRPTLQAVAAAVGLTKQGVLHHFPTRAALDDALIERCIVRVDDLMDEAAGRGAAVETYMRLATPTREERAVAVTVLAALGTTGLLPAAAVDAAHRWEALMAVELGDPATAEAARLAADGLFMEALASGVPVPAARVDRLVAVFTGRSRPGQEGRAGTGAEAVAEDLS